MFWKKILYYLDLRTLFASKKAENVSYEKSGDDGVLDDGRTINKEVKPNFNLKMMHGINRISILMFIVCIIVMIIKFCF